MNTNCGITVNEVRVIPDVEKIIVENIRLLSKKLIMYSLLVELDLLMTTLLASISKAFKLKYCFHPEAYKILNDYYGKRKFNDGRKKWQKCRKEQN